VRHIKIYYLITVSTCLCLPLSYLHSMYHKLGTTIEIIFI